jgi:CRP/FNR family cyclic AMP-dependent transcriptional regulator
MLDIFRHEPEVVSLQPGEFLFRPGDASGAHMFAIIEGEIEISRNGEVIARLGPGELVGEMALFDPGPRVVDAKALTPVRAAVVAQKRFMFLVQQHPVFAIDMLRMVATRIRASMES